MTKHLSTLIFKSYATDFEQEDRPQMSARCEDPMSGSRHQHLLTTWIQYAPEFFRLSVIGFGEGDRKVEHRHILNNKGNCIW